MISIWLSASNRALPPGLPRLSRCPITILTRMPFSGPSKREGWFNLIDSREGGEVDFWLLTDDAFDQSRFLRRQTESCLGLRIDVSTAEDTILAKLNRAKLSGGSDKQFTDALRVFEVQCDQLDLAYLEQWVEILGLHSLWSRLKDEAVPL
jgi:hypothetical protein